MSVIETLFQRFESIGWRVVVPYARRAAAIRDVVARHGRGELDEAFYQEYLAPLVAESKPPVANPRSLILVAVPDRPVRVHLTLDGAPFAALAFPGCLRKPRSRLPGLVREILEPAGFSVARADGPMKTIAVMSGLVRYGRNNLTYIEGLGSFYHLAILVSDVPCEDSPPCEPERLARCESCRARRQGVAS